MNATLPRVWWTHRVRAAVAVRGAARAVLYALADRADDDGVAWPGQAQIALDAGLTDRGVRKLLPDLVAAGYLVRVGSKHGVDVWRLAISEAGGPTGTVDRNHVPDRNDVPPEPRSADTGTTFLGDRNDVPPAPEPRSDKGPKKGSEKGPGKGTRTASEPSAVDLDVLSVWAAYRHEQANPPPDAPHRPGRARRADPPKGWGIAERVREHGPERLIRMVEWVHRSMDPKARFLRGTSEDSRGKRFDEETLFRPDKCESYCILADEWDARGRTDEAQVRPRGRDRPTRQEASFLDRLAALPPALDHSDADDRSRREDPVCDAGGWWTHPAS